MKKSVVPLILMLPLLGGRKCIPAGFLKIFDSWSIVSLKKFFDFFSELLLLSSENVQQDQKQVVEQTAKNRIISTFIFYFSF